MQTEIKNLKTLFQNIKNKGLNKSLREGHTSIGFTFESLINKKEDNFSLPDYNRIEIKTKLGYSKKPLTLLTITLKKDNDRASKYPNVFLFLCSAKSIAR